MWGANPRLLQPYSVFHRENLRYTGQPGPAAVLRSCQPGPNPPENGVFRNPHAMDLYMYYIQNLPTSSSTGSQQLCPWRRGQSIR